MTALDFNEDRSIKLEYVMDRIQEARAGDFTSGNYCLFIMDTDGDLYSEAEAALADLEAYYLA
jgi:hypothetical protein